MKILVTGAAGFLGTRLIESLLAGQRGLPSISSIVAADIGPSSIRDDRVKSRTGTVTDPAFIQSIVEPDVGAVCHLAAVLSGQSEAEFDVGMQVNVDATRRLLEACRALAWPPRFVFASSVAVFGGPLPAIVPDNFALLPQSSYGTAKAIAELLVSDYSRRGFVDGISCRLPTVAIRPGKPNSAMSSFVSGIVREPLAGIDSVCPVPLDTRLWITAPGIAVANLIHALRLDTAALGDQRAVTLPGISTTPAAMLDSLTRLAGPEVRARVRCEPDERMMRVVCTWPGAFDVARPLQLGFTADPDVDSIVQEFIASSCRPGSS
jgi:nucleoside-diphosphate-sugar epimerase